MSRARLAIINDLQMGVGDHPKRKMERAAELCERAVDELNATIKPDITWILGDLVQEPDEAETEARYTELLSHFKRLESLWRILPGNHDWPPSRFFDFFPLPLPREDIAGLRLMPFIDEEAPGYCAERSAYDLERMRAARDDGWEGPAIGLQHMSFHPPGSTDCPFNMSNHEACMEAMTEGGFSLSVGAHHHDGLDVQSDKQRYIVCRALCEAPHPFSVIDCDLETQLFSLSEVPLG